MNDKHNTKYNTLISGQPYACPVVNVHISGTKMSIARVTRHRGSIPGRSRPFRDGWQAYNNAYLKNALYVPIFASLRCLGSLQYFHRTAGVYHVGQLVCQRHAQLSASQHPY